MIKFEYCVEMETENLKRYAKSSNERLLNALEVGRQKKEDLEAKGKKVNVTKAPQLTSLDFTEIWGRYLHQ